MTKVNFKLRPPNEGGRVYGLYRYRYLLSPSFLYDFIEPAAPGSSYSSLDFDCHQVTIMVALLVIRTSNISDIISIHLKKKI